jgi:hypothetical protein
MKEEGCCHSKSMLVPTTLLLTCDTQVDTQRHRGLARLKTPTPKALKVEGGIVSWKAGTLALSMQRGPMTALASAESQVR